MRPDVHDWPWPSAVMSRLPRPSRWALAVELVIVSISPVPKTPWPVLYFHTRGLTPVPARPLKLSDQTRDHPPARCTRRDPAAAVAGNTATAMAIEDRIVRTNCDRFMAPPRTSGQAHGHMPGPRLLNHPQVRDSRARQIRFVADALTQGCALARNPTWGSPTQGG